MSKPYGGYRGGANEYQGGYNGKMGRGGYDDYGGYNGYARNYGGGAGGFMGDMVDMAFGLLCMALEYMGATCMGAMVALVKDMGPVVLRQEGIILTKSEPVFEHYTLRFLACA